MMHECIVDWDNANWNMTRIADENLTTPSENIWLNETVWNREGDGWEKGNVSYL